MTAERRGGFTLVELLVALAIIAVLLGLMSAGLAQVRQSGRRVQCLANLRSFGVALRLYANDHDGFLPRAGLLPDLLDGHNELALSLQGYLESRIPTLEEGGVIRVEAPWRCPADRGLAELRGSSYAYDFNWVIDTTRADGDRFALRKASQLAAADPSMVLMSDPPASVVLALKLPTDPRHPRGDGSGRLALFSDGRADWAPNRTGQP
jgi:prepilin-type N-terminal cleavage/methylation domain-containing protein